MYLKTNACSGSKCSVGNSGRLRNYVAGSAGKRGRAVELSTTSTTRRSDTERKEELFDSTNTFLPVTMIPSEFNIVDLFSIGASKGKEEKGLRVTEPFVYQVRFHGPQGEVVRAWANIDDGAMKEVMSSSMFRRVKHRLGPALPSSQLLRVANGVVVGSEAKWEGKVGGEQHQYKCSLRNVRQRREMGLSLRQNTT
jgi:hypothetical protein